MLVQAQQGMPLPRSLSLVDGEGRVLASSAPDNVDLVLKRVPLPAPDATDRLGPLINGRDIGDVLLGHEPSGAGHTFVPLMRWASVPGQAPLYLLAALNVDYFANEHQLMLGDPSRAAALFDTDGTLLPTCRDRRARLRSGADRTGAHPVLGRRCAGGGAGPGRHHGRPGPAQPAQSRGRARCTRERVAASERDLRMLVQSVHELIFRTDAAGRINFVNGRWAQISGLPDGAVLGRWLSQLCLPEDQAAVEALFAPSPASGPATESLMLHIRTVQGGLCRLEVSVSAMGDADRALVGFAGFAADVSERQLARSNLQAQLEMTARLLEVSPTPMFVKDSAGRLSSCWPTRCGLCPKVASSKSAATSAGARVSNCRCATTGPAFRRTRSRRSSTPSCSPAARETTRAARAWASPSAARS